jgi:hypothetical protein
MAATLGPCCAVLIRDAKAGEVVGPWSGGRGVRGGGRLGIGCLQNTNARLIRGERGMFRLEWARIIIHHGIPLRPLVACPHRARVFALHEVQWRGTRPCTSDRTTSASDGLVHTAARSSHRFGWARSRGALLSPIVVMGTEALPFWLPSYHTLNAKSSEKCRSLSELARVFNV